MSEGRSNAGIWLVVGLLVGGVGCVGVVVLIGAFAGAGFWFAARSAEVEPIVVSSPIAPAAAEPDAGLPFCAITTGEHAEEEIRLYVQLTATRFSVAATDGTLIALAYEGEAYPYDALREQLADRRQIEPNRRDVFVTTEPGVPAAVAPRVVTLAREVGFSGAVHCRERTEVDDLLLGEAPGAVGADPSAAAGDPDNFGFGGLGLRGGADEDDDEGGTVGLGNLGTIGDGTGSGYGRGAGGLRGRARVPRVGTGTLEVRGSLSREVIRRVIRRHINEVRFCYEQELNAHPELEGNVAVNFIISQTGSVLSAAVATSTIGSVRVESCVTQAVRRWSFPAPDGGIVAVNQTFVLSTGT